MKDYVILKELKQREEKLKETKKYLQSEIQQKNEERFRNFNDKQNHLQKNDRMAVRQIKQKYKQREELME